MPRALLSVTDKTGLADFAAGLNELGYELLSTGGTAKTLREAGLAVTDVAEVTGFPEMLDGRIKTLHPMIHGALLGDVRLESHRDQMAEAGITKIDLAVVNLYAFESTISGEHRMEDAIESIDIGGPTMIRSAAKNWASTSVVVDPIDYDLVLGALQDGGLDEEFRLKLSAKAFRHTAFYDSMISRYLTQASGEEEFSETLTVGFRRKQSMRYGENSHQPAALYIDPLTPGGVARGLQIHGKELSYNNILDAEAAWELACDLPHNAVAIIKHGNPCGAAALGELGLSFEAARLADPISAFGGIAACLGVVDQSAAEAITKKGCFLEVVIAMSFTEEAREVFRSRAGWGADVRLIEAEYSRPETFLSVRSVRGGALVQRSDEDAADNWRVVTHREPTESELDALRMAWRIVPHVKSNGIVVAAADRLLGVGAGQMNRVQSVRLALAQAGDAAKGAALASDAFFPFPDNVETAAEAGISCLIQPGGSKKDQDVIDTANRLGLAMILTGVRHFRH